MLGSAESEHLRLTDREIIFEEFQPNVSSQSINVTDRETDGQTNCNNMAVKTGRNSCGIARFPCSSTAFWYFWRINNEKTIPFYTFENT